MSSSHSFFISQGEYCVEKEGLIKYLFRKINSGNLCLLCENHNGKDMESGGAVRNHMLDKGHCSMNTDNYEQYKEFYDFSALKRQLGIPEAQGTLTLQSNHS